MTITVDHTNKWVLSTASITDAVECHLTLRDLEDDPEGMINPVIHQWRALDLGGGAFFYQIDLVNGYSWKFPIAGNYTMKGNIKGPEGNGGSISSLVIPYDIAFYVQGNMDAASTVVGNFIAPRTISLKSGLTDSVARALIAPQSAVTYSIQVNGIAKGSITFAAFSTTGAFTWTTGLNLVAGDLLEIVTPSSVETYIKDLSVCIVGFATATVGTMLP